MWRVWEWFDSVDRCNSIFDKLVARYQRIIEKQDKRQQALVRKMEIADKRLKASHAEMRKASLSSIKIKSLIEVDEEEDL